MPLSTAPPGSRCTLNVVRRRGRDRHRPQDRGAAVGTVIQGVAVNNGADRYLWCCCSFRAILNASGLAAVNGSGRDAGPSLFFASTIDVD